MCRRPAFGAAIVPGDYQKSLKLFLSLTCLVMVTVLPAVPNLTHGMSRATVVLIPKFLTHLLNRILGTNYLLSDKQSTVPWR